MKPINFYKNTDFTFHNGFYADIIAKIWIFNLQVPKNRQHMTFPADAWVLNFFLTGELACFHSVFPLIRTYKNVGGSYSLHNTFKTF